MTIRKRLLLGLLPCLALILAVGLLAYAVLWIDGGYDERVIEISREHDTLLELQLTVQQAIDLPHHHLIRGDPAERFAELASEVEAYFAALEALMEEVPEEDRIQLARLRDDWQRARALVEAILVLPDPGDDLQGIRLKGQLDAAALKLRDDFRAYHRRHKRRLTETKEAARQIRSRAKLALILGTGLALISGLAFVWHFAFTIARPIKALVHTAEALGRGDLKARAPTRGGDELARLGRTLNAMAEALRQRLFEGVPLGLYRTTPEGRILDVNYALVKILGYPNRELLLKVRTVDLFVNPEDRHRFQIRMKEEGFVQDFVVKLRRYDGKIIWTRTTAQAIRDEQGRISYYEGSLEDITEQVRAEEEIRRQTAHLEALNTIIAAAAAATDLSKLLETALEQILKALGLKMGGIWVPGRQVIRGLPPEIGPASAQVAQASGLAILGPIAVEDWQARSTDEPLSKLIPLMSRFGICASLTVPIVSEGRRSGGMCLCAEEPRRWSPEEVELTEAVGRQLGAVVERLRLLEEERQRSRQLILVARIAHQAVTQLDPDALLQETAHALHEIFGYPDVLIALVDPEQKMLIRKAWAGVYRRTSLKEDRRPITDRGILDWVVVHGQTVLANDVSKDPRYLAFSPDTQAELCVPIKDGERVIGCINVESDRLNAFDPADAMALEALANELAVALRNAELFAQTQRKIKELTALNEVGRALMTTLELDELLEVIYRQVRAIMETEAFFIALYDAQANELDYRIRVDRDIREPQERRTPGGLTGQIVRSGRPILIRDWERERGQYPQPRLWGTMEIPASWLGVPLKIGERVVGVISVQAYRPHAYDEGHLELLSTLAGMAAVAIENAQLYKQLEEAYIEAILALANAIAARHAYTADHSVRLTEWAVATAKELGCAEEEIEALRWAALLHDLGKIGVPDELLLKPGPLTEEEWTVMKRHPEIGARIVAPVKKLSAAASIIRAHHERWDGTGYPDGLKGEEIPLGARILAVVDAYGAMIDERSYRPAKSPEEAVTELKRCAGTQFDPQVVEAFLRVLGHTG